MNFDPFLFLKKYGYFRSKKSQQTLYVEKAVKGGFIAHSGNFFGFLPHKKGRKKKLINLLENNSTTILYESPHRLLKLLEEIKENDKNNRKISVSRELTKIHEETVHGFPDQLIIHFSKKTIKGEIVVVVDKLKANKNNKQIR